MTNPIAGSRHSSANVLGVRIDPSTLEESTRLIDGWIASETRTYICVCTANNIVEATRSEEYRRALNGSGFNTSDGMPLVWQLHRRGFPGARRVYGPDLMLTISAAGIARGWRHFYFGGADGTAGLLAERLRQRFPGLSVAGTASPPMAGIDELCTDDIAAELNASGADIVWVGLGSPKQELWMARMRDRLTAPILVGVGAAFDFHTGRVRQAPVWMQEHGLEWSFRLFQEPRRLWRRYLIGNSRFVWELARSELGFRSPRAE